MKERPMDSTTTKQSGMTLIEILVAIVILSIGLLGLAGLQLKGMQVNQGSTWRWQAAALAEDLADRIRADSQVAKTGAYNITANVPTSTSASAGTAAALQEWLSRVQALPGGSADVAAVGGGSNQMSIRVSWDDSRGKAGESAGSVGTTATASTAPQTTFFVISTQLYD
jgi:type IV pilus assembly protein PilV